MPFTAKRNRKYAPRMSLSAKEDMLVMRAEEHIRKTSRRQNECQAESDWILFPKSPKKDLAKSKISADDVRSKATVPSPRLSSSTLYRVSDKLEMSSNLESERKCKANTKSDRAISKVDDHVLTPHWTPPPAPSPPRLLTPDLEAIPESTFWSCCKSDDDKQRKEFRG